MVRRTDWEGKPDDASSSRSSAAWLVAARERMCIPLKSNGKMVELKFKPHPPRVTPTDFFWSGSWVIPADQPTGSFTYKVIATDNQGNTQTWEPFKIATSQLTVVAGEPPMAPKAQ
jgi:hypothetical protein